jgi:transposase InsO family protein
MLLRRYGCVGERRWRIVLTDALHKCSIPPFWMVFSKTFSELVRGVGTRDYISNICDSGKPEFIRSDNGPEFVSDLFQSWLKRVSVEPIHIYPGSPWENGYNERFNGTLRNEILNANWFQTTSQAQATINCWVKEYNHIRPHQGLGMRTPIPETTTLKLAQTEGA